MRFSISALPILAAFACTTPLAEAPVRDLSLDGAELRVGPNDFDNPDCMWAYIDEVRAIEEQYTDAWRQEEAGFRAWYQDARAAGASPEELAEIRDEAFRVRDMLFEEFYAVLAELESDVCGDVVDPCDDPSDPDCCPYVGENGECYDDYCAAYPDDPDCQVWCDDPNDPACFCEDQPDHPDCDPEPPCDPDAGMECPEPEPCDPATGQDCPEPDCDPATGVCCDEADPNCQP